MFRIMGIIGILMYQRCGDFVSAYYLPTHLPFWIRAEYIRVAGRTGPGQDAFGPISLENRLL
jgi:hypothetical protein